MTEHLSNSFNSKMDQIENSLSNVKKEILNEFRSIREQIKATLIESKTNFIEHKAQYSIAKPENIKNQFLDNSMNDLIQTIQTANSTIKNFLTDNNKDIRDFQTIEIQLADLRIPE